MPDRDRLIAAIYDAAADPNAYERFVAALSEYLENTAVRAWKLRDLSEIDIGVIEADRGLALHFANMNERLAQASDRGAPGSLRERIAGRSGLALLIDRQGHVASLSPAARAMFQGDVPTAEALADLLHADDARRLRNAVTDHVVHQRSVAPGILRAEAFHLVQRTLRCEATGLEYLGIEALTVTWSPHLETLLETSFALTPAEMRVLRRLVVGENVKSMSRRFARSEGTVRNQIKSILAKTGAGGLANLNRIVALIAENVAGAPAPSALRTGASVKLDILTLPDGRALEVRQQGPADGHPVLFIHGMLFGSELPGPALDCLKRYGLRLIAPSRPNFGLSDPPPGPPEAEADRLVEDLVFVLDHYGLDRTVCLTNIVGAIYGYALAAAVPERISGLVHAAASIPVLKARQFVSMPPTQRLICFLMRFAPAFLPPLLQSGIAQLRASGAGPFLDTLYEEGTCDHAVTQRPDLSDLLKRSVHFATDRGYLPAYTDTAHVVRDWSGYAAKTCALGRPSIHVHGDLDPQYPLRDLAHFTGRFQNMQLRRVEGAGQLVLFDQPEPIIRAVAELAGQGAGAGENRAP
ncbi:alpha/beta fold hydrolase [Aestuariicoccus sp. MJ-SS9]|uniref:alpha/beta fold hydrolase n=1 Tax=Aestuariicoccus sp. MJ-SS9 TaxID=3079855 RepID=UPI00291211D6|nr:alpha/beta fold hydrolase [Aestuariicoccus sp. MJ-SS9]MDU8911175.1 alpha/beta fold hydrolase [Aestuariicoccus sp. MJ-SS9]